MAEKVQEELIEFMFRRAPDGTLDVMQCLQLWFGKSNDTDIEIQRRFGDYVANALNGGFRHWTTTPRGCLALMILIDQFPRSIYRHTVRSFAGDTLSRDLVYNSGHDWLSVLAPEECIFVPCLILTHQERLEDQVYCLEFYNKLEPKLPSQLHIFRTILEEHHRIIALCGTFPHRDHYYNRPTSTIGKSLLDNPTVRFDLPLCAGADGKLQFGHDPVKLWKATQKALEVVDRIDALIGNTARRRSSVNPDYFTLERQAECAEIFKTFDKDGSGFLETSELAIALAATGHCFSEGELQRAVDAITGCENSLGLTFKQFADLLRINLSSTLESRMERHFEHFDANQSGEVDLEEFTAFVQGIDSLITTAEAAAMFQQCDRDGSGSLSLQEFLGVMQRKFSTVGVDISSPTTTTTKEPDRPKISIVSAVQTVVANAREPAVAFNTAVWDAKLPATTTTQVLEVDALVSP